MTLQDLGNLGELVAAIATVLTLGYLAIQLRQNTRALRSQTFQQSSMDMSLTANAISSDGELAEIVVKASNGIGVLSPEERVYGSSDPIRIEGFVRSIITLLSSGGPLEWWESSKSAFSSDFVKYADEKIATKDYVEPLHPGMNE